MSQLHSSYLLSTGMPEATKSQVQGPVRSIIAAKAAAKQPLQSIFHFVHCIGQLILVCTLDTQQRLMELP